MSFLAYSSFVLGRAAQVTSDLQQNHSVLTSVGVSDVRKTLKYIVKSTKVPLKFEWKRMKGFDANKKLWNTNNFKSSIADRKGQNVICGKAKWRNVKYDTLCKKVANLEGQEEAQQNYMELKGIVITTWGLLVTVQEEIVDCMI